MNDTVLRLEDVAVGYGSAPLYDGVSLRGSRGELVTLLGANGAGKSTLLRCVTGRLAPMRGLVEVAGRSLSEIPPRELARLVSIVSTGRELAGALTVAELVALGRQPHTGFFGRLSRHDREVVGLAMAAVGMEGFAQRQVASLSDGERQKVMIARALAQETPLMVLDEPTAFLDVASRLGSPSPPLKTSPGARGTSFRGRLILSGCRANRRPACGQHHCRKSARDAAKDAGPNRHRGTTG